MDFNYDVLSEEEAQKARFQLLEDGTYKGIIEHIEHKPSASGNPMLALKIRVWNEDGSPKEINDWITLIPSMMWKLRHLCISAGLLKEFEDKTFKPEMLEGREVMLKIKFKAGTAIPENKLNGKTPGEKYPDRNAVDDYVELLKNSGMKPLPEAKDDFNDEIPF